MTLEELLSIEKSCLLFSSVRFLAHSLAVLFSSLFPCLTLFVGNRVTPKRAKTLAGLLYKKFREHPTLRTAPQEALWVDLVCHHRKCILENLQGRGVKQNEGNLLKRSLTAQVLPHLVEHNRGTPVDGKSGDACSNRGKGDGRELFFRGAFETVDRSRTKAFFTGQSAKVHAGGMNDVWGFELPALSQCGFA